MSLDHALLLLSTARIPHNYPEDKPAHNLFKRMVKEGGDHFERMCLGSEDEKKSPCREVLTSNKTPHAEMLSKSSLTHTHTHTHTQCTPT